MSGDVNEPSGSDEIPLVRWTESKLRALLDHAAQVKHSTDVEPALQHSDFEASIVSLDISSSEKDASTTEPTSATPQSNSSLLLPSSKTPLLHVALETAARNIFYPLITATPITSPHFVAVWNLLDLLQFCADHSLCDPSLPLRHVEELLDSQTIDGCRHVFDYMESRRERLMGLPLRYAAGAERSLAGGNGEDGDGTAAGTLAAPTKKERDTLTRNKEMIVLRSCNELLRRLSRAEDTVFCGRVFMFLFQSFELGNKASVNLRGEFHTENVTVFDEVGEREKVDVEAGDEVMDLDQATKDGGKEEESKPAANGDVPIVKEPGKDESVAKKDDGSAEAQTRTQRAEDQISIDELYTTFWSLQHVFSNPTKLFVNEEFEKFKRGLDVTLSKFRSVPKILQAHGTPRISGGLTLKRKRTRDTDESEFASNFNPKYLTSRDLFELEISDLTFQRHILIQTLITIDFLLSLTAKAKTKLSTLKAQKAMLYPYTLSETDTKWAMDHRAQIASYLQEGPDGKFYYRMADTVLARDKNWVRWKIESCPAISKPPVPTTEQMDAIKSAKRQCAPRRIKANPMGAIDMSFVSDTKNVNDLETLKNPDRCRVPRAEKWVDEIERLDLDLEMASPDEEAYMKEGRTTALWRALRVAGRTKFNILDKIDEGAGLKMLKRNEEQEGDNVAHTMETNEDKEGADVNVDGVEADTAKKGDEPSDRNEGGEVEGAEGGGGGGEGRGGDTMMDEKPDTENESQVDQSTDAISKIKSENTNLEDASGQVIGNEDGKI